MGKFKVGKNPVTGKILWKFDVNLRVGGRHRTKQGEEFEGTRDEAKEEVLRIKKFLRDSVKKSHEKRICQVRTFGDALKLYKVSPMKNGRMRVQESSYLARYEALLKNLGKVPIYDIFGALKRYLENLSGTKTKGGGNYKTATLNRYAAMAKGAVTSSYKTPTGPNHDRLIPQNYLDDFPLKPENNVRHRVLDKDERRTLYNAMPEWMQPIFYFACRVPARIGELRALTKRNLNLKKRLIYLDANMTKTKTERWLPIFPEMVPYFESIYFVDCEYLFFKTIKNKKKNSIRHIPLGDFKKAYHRACAKAGIDHRDFNFHKTRQMAAMSLLYDDFREIEVMMIGGWKSMAAFRRYARADDVMLMKKLGVLQEEDKTWKKDLAPREITHVA